MTKKEKRIFNVIEACQKRAKTAIEYLEKAIKSPTISSQGIKAAEIILAYGYGKPDSNLAIKGSLSIASPAQIVAEIEKRRALRGELIGRTVAQLPLPEPSYEYQYNEQSIDVEYNERTKEYEYNDKIDDLDESEYAS